MDLKFEIEINKIQDLAQQILNENPDPPVRIRLLRDVLHYSSSNENLLDAYHDLEKSKWFINTKTFFENQYDGFYGKDKVGISVFDLHYYINQAIDFGLQKDHPTLLKIRELIETVFKMGVPDTRHLFLYPYPTNRVKILDSNYELILAQCLSALNPGSVYLMPVFERWHTIAKTAFQSGQYNRYDEKNGYESVYGVTFEAEKCQRFRITAEISCHDCLELFNNKVNSLEPRIAELYYRWQWKREVSGRLSTLKILSNDSNKAFVFVSDFLVFLKKLSDFRSWPKSFGTVVNLLWNYQMANGLWDFGNNEGAFPLRLSNSWRGKYRKHDWSARVFILLAKYYLFRIDK